jgi:hypothetical protein
MRLTAKNMYYLLLGLIGVSLLVVGIGVYLSSNLLQQKSKDVSKAKLRIMVAEANQEILRKAKVDIEKYKDLAEIAKIIVPQDKDQTQTVREISNLASQNGVVLESVTFPSSNLSETQKTLTQLTPVPTMPGVYVLPITITSQKSPPTFDAFINFLSALEHNRRTALTTSIILDPDPLNPPHLKFTLVINEYIKP